MEFVDDTTLDGVTDTIEDRIRIQNDHDKLEKWSKIEMKFTKHKLQSSDIRKK